MGNLGREDPPNFLISQNEHDNDRLQTLLDLSGQSSSMSNGNYTSSSVKVINYSYSVLKLTFLFCRLQSRHCIVLLDVSAAGHTEQTGPRENGVLCSCK